MSDDLARIIRRDLDSLPLLPETRWIPAPPISARPPLMAFRVAWLALFAGIAFVAGMAIDQTRTVTVPTTTESPIAGEITRRDVLARISNLSGELPRIDRIEAKRITSGVPDRNPALAAPSSGSASTWWVVAISGDVRCAFCAAPATPLHSAMYWVDARTGEVKRLGASSEVWPRSFDDLTDTAIAPQSLVGLVTVIEMREVDVIVVRAIEPIGTIDRGAMLVLRAGPNSSYSWQSGPLGGSAYSIAELIRTNKLSTPSTPARVVFSSEQRSDGSYSLEELHTGALSR